MSDVLVVAAVVAFFAIGAAYIVLCARILAATGDIDEPPTDEADAMSDAEPAADEAAVSR